MSKNYVVQFGSGSPALNTGLSPTFTVFNVVPGGGATTPPGITEVPTATGLFYFTYEPAASIAFVIDAGVTLGGTERYLAGQLDPTQAVDERITELGTSLTALSSSLTAMGVTIVAIGNTGNSSIGTLADSFGTTLTDPTTVFGYLKRLQNFNEGNNVFTKTSGVWQVWSRGNTYVLGASTYPGSSTLIANKTISDSGSVVTKT